MIGRLEMRISRILSTAALLMAVGVHPERCFPQSIPVATQQMQVSIFSAARPISTGLGQLNNLTVTPGADIAFVGLGRPPSVIEIRVTYPLASGTGDKKQT